MGLTEPLANKPESTRTRPLRKITRSVADQTLPNLAGQMEKYTLKHLRALDSGGRIESETVKQIKPSPRVSSTGPNGLWYCESHDELCKYGFAIWGLRDKFSNKWLGLWVIPNNQLSHVIPYLWLTLVRDLGGIPMQTSSNCVAENQLVHRLADALRGSIASIGADSVEKPAQIFLRTVRRSPTEPGWSNGLQRSFSRKFIQFNGEGSGTYDEQNPLHRRLIRWLWPPLIQRELDKFRTQDNSRRVQKRSKDCPFSTSSDSAYDHPEDFDGRDCLQRVDPDFVQELLNEMQPQKDALGDWEVPPEVAECAKAALQSVNIQEVTLANVWLAFNVVLYRFKLRMQS